MIRYIKDALRHRFLLKELVIKGIRLKYRRSYLGIVWSLIEPLLTMMVLVIVFGTLLHKGADKSFPLYVISGRLLYSCFSSTTKNAARSIRKNASMIKKVYVPKYLYPLSQVLYNYLIFLISLIVLLGVMVVTRVAPTIYIFQVVPALCLLLLLCIGVGMILSTLEVFFRDVEYLWNVCLTIIMYLCAIFYDPDDILTSRWFWILEYNPMFCIIRIFRGGVLGYMASPWYYGYATLCAFGSLLVGLLFFKWKQDEFILHI